MARLSLAFIAVVLAIASVQSQGTAPTNYKFCVSPATIVAECNAAVKKADSEGIKFSCVGAGSADECMAMVKRGDATFVKVGGDELYVGGTQYGLEPVASEYYGGRAGANYYSVAVVNAEFCKQPDVSLKSLKGMRSCHTAYRRGAGWTIPVGTMISAGIMPVVSNYAGIQDDAESVAAFFSKTCAPRATKDGPLTTGTLWKDGLCTACKGDCTETGDPYIGYEGPLRGLFEGSCDVSFTKSTTVGEVVKGGTKAQAWSSKSASDLMLLCPAGGCAPIDSAETCNMGVVAAHALLATSSFKSSPAGQAAVAQIIEAAGSSTGFLSAAKALGNTAQLFQATTQELKPVTENFREYFTPGMIAGAQAMRNLGAGSNAATTSGGSSGVSQGAIVGIVIAIVVVAVVLGFFAIRHFRRNKRSEFSTFAHGSSAQV